MELAPLNTDQLSFDDLYKLARVTEDLANNSEVPSAVGEWFYDLYRAVNDEFLARVPETAGQALAQVMLLAADTIESEHRLGPVVVAQARAAMSTPSAADNDLAA